MADWIFIGDEVAAAGWRLAGATARVPAPGQEAAALATALEEASLVLLAAPVAARIPEAPLRAALRRVTPVTVVLPDLREAVPYPDVAARLRRQLGIES
jgi:vacuolar-type H+-ATPase subunit F/Vma7